METMSSDATNKGTMSKSGKHKQIQVHIRKSGGKSGFEVKSCKPSITVRELKDDVVASLQPSWEENNFTLRPEHIRLFRVVGDTIMPVGDEDDLVTSGENPPTTMATIEDEKKEESPEPKFIALEYFTTLPEDLFRTVSIRQISPVTYAAEGNGWTKAAPLCCAAYTETEWKRPWYGTKQGNFKAHGVSLRSLDTSETSMAGRRKALLSFW
ncbi:expressed unknown protein [Seminavis robusta]|uniref:Uncharacterized protein n=1 Tax=Seminavis robusta TaxID=568900 RepID=A0A9N8D4P6_9STRA|nr:expressed unknown protein [Seminavis robusta]|eukprot:Sro4_g003720.1 n/a (211) ;mRNA; f:228254-228886